MRIVLTILLIVLLILLLLLIIVLLSSAVVSVEYWNGEFRYAVRYFGIQVYPFRKKRDSAPKDPEKEAEKEEKKAQKKAQKEEQKKAEKEAAKAEKKKLLIADKMRNAMQALAERSDMIADILFAVPAPLRKLLRAVTFGKVEIDFLIANEDAADCAMLYGRMQAIVWNLLANLSKHIHVQRKQVQLACDFAADESRWNIRFCLNLHIGTTVAAALWFLWKYWRGGKKADKAIGNPVI